jgi:beta-glucanase (GH16 family)/transcriptional regulator with XRE-family HTH domain
MLQVAERDAEHVRVSTVRERPTVDEPCFATAEDEAACAIGLLAPARLGVLLRGRRRQAHVKVLVAAQAAGLEKTAFQEIEAGRSAPDVSVLAALLKCYRVPVGEFVPPRRPLVVPDPDATSDEILRSFVVAVRKWRDAGRREKLDFRLDDVSTLSMLLGTDPDAIERRLIALTGCSRAEARILRKWFLAALITIPLAATTAGGIVPVAASAATARPMAAATYHRAASTPASGASTKAKPSVAKKHHKSKSKQQRRSASGTHKSAATVAPSSSAAAQGTAATPSDANASAHTALRPAGVPGAWKVALDSEFRGTSLDTSIWQPGWFGSGTTGPVNTLEAACYSSDNVLFPGDGSVHLRVTASPSTCKGKTEPYTGALLSSNPHDGRASGGFEYTYGAIEARVYIPASSGSQIANWPAIWTDGQSWPATGEDDIMEGLSGKACFHFHSTVGASGTCVAGSYTGWHTFASDWEPGSVTYYYDGVKVGQITTGITASPMYILLDNTVMAGSGALATPADMQVAYVRVWQH